MLIKYWVDWIKGRKRSPQRYPKHRRIATEELCEHRKLSKLRYAFHWISRHRRGGGIGKEGEEPKLCSEPALFLYSWDLSRQRVDWATVKTSDSHDYREEMGWREEGGKLSAWTKRPTQTFVQWEHLENPGSLASLRLAVQDLST